MSQKLDELREKWADRIRQNPGPLNQGGGGGTFDGMEARVAKLEADLEHVKRDVTELRTDMRDVRDRAVKIEADIRHLPSKAFVFGVYGVVGAILAAIMLFQTQIQTLLGVTPSP